MASPQHVGPLVASAIIGFGIKGGLAAGKKFITILADIGQALEKSD